MYLLFDIGGTKMRITISEDGVSLKDIKTYDTPKSFDKALDLLSTLRGGSFKTIVGGVPGILDKDKSSMVCSPNLDDWIGMPIKNEVEKLFNTKVVLENDAALAGLGEACFGAGKDKEIVAYLTISTGIGGARIVGQKIDVSLWGFEPGKHIIDADLSLWSEGGVFSFKDIPPGSIESYISGTALKRRFGKPSYEIDDKDVWSEVEKLLAVTIHNILSFWSPETVVLGGGIVLGDAVNIEKVREHLAETANIFPFLPDLKKAELGGDAALYGGLALIK